MRCQDCFLSGQDCINRTTRGFRVVRLSSAARQNREPDENLDGTGYVTAADDSRCTQPTALGKHFPRVPHQFPTRPVIFFCVMCITPPCIRPEVRREPMGSAFYTPDSAVSRCLCQPAAEAKPPLPGVGIHGE